MVASLKRISLIFGSRSFLFLVSNASRVLSIFVFPSAVRIITPPTFFIFFLDILISISVLNFELTSFDISLTGSFLLASFSFSRISKLPLPAATAASIMREFRISPYVSFYFLSYLFSYPLFFTYIRIIYSWIRI